MGKKKKGNGAKKVKKRPHKEDDGDVFHDEVDDCPFVFSIHFFVSVNEFLRNF
jgi:hypothetical protein